MMNAVNIGPRYGERIMKKDQILIFRARSCTKKMSLMNIRPPPWATVEKKPLRTRAASCWGYVVAPAEKAAVQREKAVNQNRIGRHPKYAM